MHGATPGRVTSNQNDSTTPTISEPASVVTNDQFLAAIFGSDFKNAKPLVCNISGNPEGLAWPAQAWPCDTSNASLNWYVQPSLFEPNVDGQYRAQKKLAGKVFCVMLDDIGTKVPFDRFETCLPTWLIKTSPDNYQLGYVFSEPIDAHHADALKSALIEAALCDRGASGGATRWMRLPVGINGKSKYGPPAFPCKLVEWHPDKRYTVEEIIDRLGLVPSAVTDKSVFMSQTEDDVYIPRPYENEVISALKARGLYKQPIGAGKHDVTCPWVHEHTDQNDDGSTYFEPSDLYPIGGFKCHHGHGDKYRIKALIEFLGMNIQAAKHKSIIMISAGELHRIVDTSERELAATKRFYQRGGLIVCIAHDSELGDELIKPLSQPALVRALSGCAIWMRYDGRTARSLVIDPPGRYVTVLHDSGSYTHLPVLTGIARQPHLRPDGTLVMEAGFDTVTGRFGVFDPQRFDVPCSPSQAQALNALQELKELLAEFEFGSESDLAAALAGILTATIRPSLSAAPMIHVRAPVISSGKSFFCNIFAAFASPAAPSALAFPTNEEECQKLLLASLLSSPATIVFDNLTTDIVPFKSLCSALTEERLMGRILGVSKTATVGTRVLFLSSGNNVSAVRDMARRCITIALDPKVETPATRKFNGNPLAVVRAHRERYVSLALTIIRAWIAAGRPITKVSPLASYEQWSDWVRQPLLWLGMVDPADCVFEQLQQDPDREVLGRLLHAWHSEFGTKPTMIREVLDKVKNFGKDELWDALREVAEERGEINRRRLGKWIARHNSRIVDGMRFEKASGTTSAERWSVKLVKSVTSGRSLSFDGIHESRGAIGGAGLILPSRPHHTDPLH